MPASLKATEKGPPGWAALVFFYFRQRVFSVAQNDAVAVIHTGGRGGKKHHALYKGQTTTARVARPQVTTPPTREMTSWATPREVNPR